MERTPRQLGEIIKTRRDALGRTQVKVLDVAKAAGHEFSDPTYRAIEGGRSKSVPTGRVLAGISVGLDWPPDALAKIAAGANPATIDAPIEMSASGIDLDELRRVDPEMYEQIRNLARTALERAAKRS